MQQEVESYQRIQALNLLQDMVDRVNANRLVANCYSYDDTGATFGTGASAITACTAGTAEQNARVADDLQEWHNALLGASEQVGTDTVGAMVGARGCVQQINAGERTYRITVAWQGLSETVAAPSDNVCGKDQYGNEKLRRIVSAIVRIGLLS